MSGSHRSPRRRGRALALNITGLAMTLALALGQFGLASAGATDRERDGSYSSDTEVITPDKDGGGSSGGDATDDGGSQLVNVKPETKGNAPKVVGVLDTTTICHATSSTTGPYNQQSPDASAVDGIQPPNGDHFLNHTGPVFDATVFTGGGGGWGDIIPPTDDDGDPLGHGGLNWTPQGQAIWNAGCVTSSSMNVTKALVGAPPGVGGTVTFSVVVSNTGTNALANVTVTDTLPAGLVPQSATFNAGTNCAPGIAGQTVTCGVGTIPFGGSVTVIITALESGAPATCSYQNTASAVSRNAAGAAVASDTSNTVTVNVTACLPPGTPDMSVIKSASATVSPGGQITYSITAENLGNAAQANVVISDNLPAGTTFVSATAPGGWTTVTPAVGANGTVTFSKASVAAGETASFTIVVQVGVGVTCGATISNTSTVAPGGSNAGNDSSTDTTSVLCANIVVAKDATATVAQGGQITYVIDVANNGTGPASNVSVSDPLPAGTTFVSAAATAGWTITSPAVGANGTVTFTKASMAVGESAQFTIVVDVDPNATCGAVISNTATGSTTSVETSTADNAGTDTTQVTGAACNPLPGLSISKTAGSAVVQPGDPVSFSITVTSTGNVAADNVVMTDTLPTIPGTTWSITGGNGAGSCSIGAGNVLTCNYGNVPPGISFTVVVATTPTTAASCGTYNNTATADASNTPPVSDSDAVQVDCSGVGPGGVDLVKTGPATAKVGDTVAYSFTVTLAPGSPDLSGFTFSDPICDPGTITGPTGDDGDNVLETGEIWGFGCTHVVTASDPDPLPNTATFCATPPGGPVVCDSDNHEVDIIHPAIDVEKEADPISGTVGTVITYTYFVTNSGDVPLFNVSVDDDVLGHICDIAVLPPNTTVTCIGTYTIPAGSPPEITNIVIAGGTDPAGDLVEDQDDFTITVVAGETVTPTKTPPGGLAFTGPSTAIPFAALALLLLGTGTGLLWLGRRRGRVRVEPPQA